MPRPGSSMELPLAGVRAEGEAQQVGGGGGTVPDRELTQRALSGEAPERMPTTAPVPSRDKPTSTEAMPTAVTPVAPKR